jgi:hypothetical protein
MGGVVGGDVGRGYTLLTRDPHSFRSYFPSLVLITPEDWKESGKRS